jgi:hypothetical protein
VTLPFLSRAAVDRLNKTSPTSRIFGILSAAFLAAAALTRWLAVRSILSLGPGSQFLAAKLVGFVARSTEQPLLFMIAACFDPCKITWSFVRSDVASGDGGVLPALVIRTIARRRYWPHGAH